MGGYTERPLNDRGHHDGLGRQNPGLRIHHKATVVLGGTIFPRLCQATQAQQEARINHNQKKNTKVDTKIKAMTQSTSDDSAFEFSDVLGIPGLFSSGESPLCPPTPVSMGAPL